MGYGNSKKVLVSLFIMGKHGEKDKYLASDRMITLVGGCDMGIRSSE